MVLGGRGGAVIVSKIIIDSRFQSYEQVRELVKLGGRVGQEPPEWWFGGRALGFAPGTGEVITMRCS